MEPNRRNRLSDLYHAALLRPVEDRSAFLKESCNRDEVLRQQVESLLQDRVSIVALPRNPRSRNRWRPVQQQWSAVSSARTLSLRRSARAGWARSTAPGHELGRDVAIKILPSHFTADPERRARFEREAVCSRRSIIHTSARSTGWKKRTASPALVLELVEGETLADRLERGAARRSTRR